MEPKPNNAKNDNCHTTRHVGLRGHDTCSMTFPRVLDAKVVVVFVYTRTTTVRNSGLVYIVELFGGLKKKQDVVRGKSDFFFLKGRKHAGVDLIVFINFSLFLASHIIVLSFNFFLNEILYKSYLLRVFK